MNIIMYYISTTTFRTGLEHCVAGSTSHPPQDSMVKQQNCVQIQKSKIWIFTFKLFDANFDHQPPTMTIKDHRDNITHDNHYR